MLNDLKNLKFETIKVDPSSLTIAETLDLVSSTKDGISQQEAKKRLVEYGENRLPKKEKESRLAIFLNNFKCPPIQQPFNI